MAFPICGAREELLQYRMPQDYYERLNDNIQCTVEEAQTIYNKFRAFSPTGKLDLYKFQECLGLFGTLGRLLTHRMFRAFDVNNDGFLDFVEFSTSLLIMTKGSEDKKIALSYRIIHPNPRELQLNLGCLTDTDSGNKSGFTSRRSSVSKRDQFLTESREPSERDHESKAESEREKEGEDPGKAESPKIETLSMNLLRRTAETIINTTRIFKSNITDISSEKSQEKITTEEEYPGIEFQDFMELVTDIALSKAYMVSREPKYYTAEEVRRVFQKYASVSPRGVQRITQRDYANAVCESDFLEMLGVSLSKYAMEAMNKAYKGVNVLLETLNRSTRGYINITKVRKKTLYKWINHARDKRGLSIHFGHESWNHVANMMIGLSLSARYVYSKPETEITESDYLVKLVFKIVEGNEGLNVTKYITSSGLSSSRFDEYKYRGVERQAYKKEKESKSQSRQERSNYNNTDQREYENEDEDEEQRGKREAEEKESKDSMSNFSSTSIVSDADFRFTRFYADNLNKRNTFGYKMNTKILFKEYAPMVFRQIRKISGIDEKDYVESVNPEQIIGNMVLGNLTTMSELVSEGKSGSLFYYTINGRMILKTISKRCAKFVKIWLHSYYKHILNNPKSLLTRFLGLFSIQNTFQKRKEYFIAMNNVFYSKVSIHRRFDLKGSWVGRKLDPAELRDPTMALKDQDFHKIGEIIKLGNKKESFLEILKKDVYFLRNSNLLDYSLLLGVHKVDPSKDYYNVEEETDGLPGKQHKKIAEDKKTIYYMGIVDLLTNWNITKRMEHVMRMFQTNDYNGVSCVNPKHYSDRFIDFIQKHLE